MKKSFLTLIVFIATLAALFSCTEEKRPPNPEAPLEHIHAFGNWRDIRKADCYHDGLKMRSCACGETEVEHVTSFNHHNSPWEGIEPDCENGGYRSRYCLECGLPLEHEVLSPLGHDYKIIAVTEATRDTAGFTTLECNNCGCVIDTDFVEALGTVHFRYEITDGGTCRILGIYSEEDYKKDAVSLLPEGADVNDIIIPEYIGSYRVESIADGAFKAHRWVEKIILPASVLYVGDEAFADCTSLKEVHFGSSLISLGNSVFKNCESLVRAELPKTVTDLGTYVFENCSSLTEARVPDEIKIIPEGLFKNCLSLKTLEFSEELTAIGDGAFENCVALESVTALNKVRSVGNYAFCECRSLKSVSFGEEISFLGFGAFRNVNALEEVHIITLADWFDIKFANSLSNPLNDAAALYVDGAKVENVTVPDGIEIYDFVFYSYDYLKSVTVPESVTGFGDYLFTDCTALSEVVISAPIEYIGDEMFRGCSSLINVSLPKTVIAICNYAFENCTSLTEITIPKAVEVIGIGAFKNCTGLLAISLDGVSRIEERAFDSCKSLASLTLSDDIRSIADKAFVGCPSLAKLNLPEGLVSIGDEAFLHCCSVMYVSIPSTLEFIGEGAFFGCEKVEKLDITDVGHWCSVELGDKYSNPLTNGAQLYINGTKPQYIIITDSVSKISDYTFWSLDSSLEIYYIGTAENFKSIIGLNNPFLYKLHLKSVDPHNYPADESGNVYYHSAEKPESEGNYWYYNKAGNICRW
ncbi:MAG: leucine-rich repeat protein [Clostridia bacterium]|nr:leucine-rich repeat protein [Clostridia bacterium]